VEIVNVATLPGTTPCRNRFPAGFTLLEVMIAVAVIAIALVALLGSQARSLGRAGETTFNTIAPMLASTKLAELGGGMSLAAEGEGDFSPSRPDYRWRVKISDPFDGRREPLPGLAAQVFRIEVVVTREATPFSYNLTSYLERKR
jgi:general secretion pathway protein I